MESDEVLMAKLQEGLDVAFEEIESRYYKIVWSLCRRILLDRAEAEDATQHAFVKLWLSRDSFSAGRPFWPWFRVIALKTCLDRLRVLERHRAVPLDVPTDEGDEHSPPMRTFQEELLQPHKQVEFLELKRAFRQCWASLPPSQRALLQCVDWSDWKGSWAKISSTTGMKPPAVRTATVRYARNLLVCLQKRGFSPTPSELLKILEETASDEEIIHGT